MPHPLDHPVWTALTTRHRALAEGGDHARRYPPAITPFADDITRELATVILPCGTFAETSGTYVNLAGTWQSFTGAAQPVGESRPAWKVLRVLGNALSLEGFDYQSSESVLAELRERVAGAAARPAQTSHRVIADLPPAEIADFAIYGSDALVRRAPALQATLAGLETVRVFGRAATGSTGSGS